MAKEANPIPQGNYVPATRCGNLIFTAGMTPRKQGVLILTGSVKADDDLGKYRDAVRQAAGNALTAARNKLEEGERIARLLTITVYINAEDGFVKHAALADFASGYFLEELGESGIAARAAIGVKTLPGNAPCEIQITAMAE